MRYTFKPDDCMVISIPLGNLRNVRDGQLMPEKFTCVFKDAYKVFLRGRPKELGAAQLSIGVFVICIGSLIALEYGASHLVYTLPSALFIASGILTFAAGYFPIMPVVKLSFAFNIICLFWSITATVLCPILEEGHPGLPNSPDASGKIKVFWGLKVVICVLCGFELILALILIYWESKAVCRAHFNTLPLITIKQDV
ncbi:membrane-spanning 4-domains subfamily A member 4A-like [Carassius auratus]|uniref:Membrane-spanning 4-domains subfamily A member 4A-like n=1 Tax=Carassius auratus TaxID=7957 RepID=A0A6P6LGA4_CARAU|nr:membrane-spanning 4-domains subfamily A member 4A-like [Carassius auratus]XP_026083644.1 membrane-spanning 4-domains subfamily A member 4A-like [Carassius auratus]